MNLFSTIALTVAGCIIFISCNNTQSHPSFDALQVQTENRGSGAAPRPKTAAELREELAQIEASDPAGMLLVRGTMQENKILIQKPNLFRHSKYATDGYIIKGIVKNRASIASFKDAVVRVTFLTETNTELATRNFNVYKYFIPHDTTSFELKVYPPEHTQNFNLQVIDALSIRR